MTNFISKWIEQIVICVIIVSLFELILPNGNFKKYIKIVLGIYIIICIISPFSKKIEVLNLENIEEYIEKKYETKINETSMDKRLQELYTEEIKKDIEKRVEKYGYKIKNIKIDADFENTNEKSGIHKINLVLNKNKKIEKVEIKIVQETNETNDEIEKIKEEIAEDYNISKNLISININKF